MASATRLASVSRGLDGLADDGGEQLELAPVLDLEGAARRRLGERLHDLGGVVGVGGGAQRVLQQQAAHGHAVGVDAAGAARRLVGDAAGALRAQGAADALHAEAAALLSVLSLGRHAIEHVGLAVGAYLFDHRRH